MNDLFRTDAFALAGVTGASALGLLAMILALPAVSHAHFDEAAPARHVVRTAALHGVTLRPAHADEATDEATTTAAPTDENTVGETLETHGGGSEVMVGEEIDIVGDYAQFGISCCGDEGWYDGMTSPWFHSRYSRRAVWRWGMPRYRGAAPMFPWMGGGDVSADTATREYTLPLGGGTLRATPRDTTAEARAAEAHVRREQTRWTLENDRVALTLDVSGACLADLDRVRATTPDGTYRCTIEETAVPWNDRDGAALWIRETRDGVTTTVQVSLGDDDARPTVTGWSARRDGAVTEHVLANEGSAAMTWTLDGREVTVPAGRAITVRMRG